MKYKRYKVITHLKFQYTNCLLFAVWYRWKHPTSVLEFQFDWELLFWHFYINTGKREIHYEQWNRKDKWYPLFKGKIVIYEYK